MEPIDKASNFAHEAIDKATHVTYEFATKIVDKGDEFNNLAHDSIDKATNATHEVVAKVYEKKQRLMNAEQQLIKKYCDYVSENPFTSLGIAAGAGFLLSKLLSDR